MGGQSILRTDEREQRLSSDTQLELQRLPKFLCWISGRDFATELARLNVRSFNELAGAVAALEAKGLVVCPLGLYLHVPSGFALNATWLDSLRHPS